MNADEEITKLLNADGAVLKRKSKHKIWLLSNGKQFVQSATPSDDRGEKNTFFRLKRLLEVSPSGRGQPGERRPKKQQYRSDPAASIRPDNSNALNLAGIRKAPLDQVVSAMLSRMRGE